MPAHDDFLSCFYRVRGWSQDRRRSYFAGLNDALQELALTHALFADDADRAADSLVPTEAELRAERQFVEI